MPEITSYEPGTPSWIDHATADLAASNTFYASLFGWEADVQGPEMGDYTRFLVGGRTVAGNMPAGEGQPSVWVTYVSVDDAEATVARAREAGATVFVEPMDVSDLGRMAVFADPTGAVLGVWEPGTFIGAELANEPGALVWNELNTRDTSAASAFYTTVFGWEAHDAPMGAMAYTEWHLAGRPVGGMLPMPDTVPSDVPDHWLAYLGVADTDATVAAAERLGATLVAGPTDIPPGRFAVLTDPDGAAFAVIALAG